ncbi:MAG: ABC transporter permease [Spirochaetales bacterium]|nr:MAG: ABC transporter permease [Spirochaetales bacterium]
MRSTSPLLKRISKSENMSVFLVLVFIILAIILVELFAVRGGAITQVAFIKPMNISNVLMQISVTGILALSMTFIMISGGIDLSIGQMMCFIGTGMAFLIRTAGMNIGLAAILAIAGAIIFQLIMGLIISRTKLESFIVSLGFLSIYRGFTYLITNGREITIEGKFRFLGRTYLDITENFRLPMPVIIFIVLSFFVWFLLRYTKFGRKVYAVGGNENAAYLAGINVKNFRLMLYGINGFFIAVATMVQLSRLGTGNPLMGEGKEIEVIAAVVVGGTALAGGRGNVWGTFIGVVLLGIISNGLNILGVNPHWQYVMRGLLIVFAVSLTYVSSLRASSIHKETKEVQKQKTG